MIELYFPSNWEWPQINKWFAEHDQFTWFLGYFDSKQNPIWKIRFEDFKKLNP
jgi:hypothetical protein